MKDLNSKRILSLGWDVGGWTTNKNAFAISIVESGKLVFLSSKKIPPKKINPHNPYELETILDEILGARFKRVGIEEYKETYKIVIAIDSPLAFPSAFVSFIQDVQDNIKTSATFQPNQLWFRQFERENEEDPGKRTGVRLYKNPLSSVTSVLTSATILAIHTVRQWKQKHEFIKIAPRDRGYLTSDHVIIEVYPGIFNPDQKTKEAGRIPELVKSYSEKLNSKYPDYVKAIEKFYPKAKNGNDKSELSVGKDECDAVLCSLLGQGFFRSESPPFPKLCEYPNNNDFLEEGWIYYPEI